MSQQTESHRLEIGTKEWADAFYAHLDACKQCREHPFDLCETGAKIFFGRADSQ